MFLTLLSNLCTKLFLPLRIFRNCLLLLSNLSVKPALLNFMFSLMHISLVHKLFLLLRIFRNCLLLLINLCKKLFLLLFMFLTLLRNLCTKLFLPLRNCLLLLSNLSLKPALIHFMRSLKLGFLSLIFIHFPNETTDSSIFVTVLIFEPRHLFRQSFLVLHCFILIVQERARTNAK